MSDIPADLRYTAEHEWVRRTGEDTVRVGITDFAAEALGDIVYVTLPQVGEEVATEDSVAEVESTKSVSEVYAPLSGVITAVNDALADAPGGVNDDAMSAWFFKITPAAGVDLSGFMDEAAYNALIG